MKTKNRVTRVGNYSDDFSSIASALAEGQKSWSLISLVSALTSPKNRKRLETQGSGSIQFNVDTFTYSTEENRAEKQAEIIELGYPKPRGVIKYVTGWKAHPVDPSELPYLAALRGAGYIVRSISLEDPGRETVPMDSNIRRMQQFLFEDNSAGQKKYEHLPHIIITHSTSSMLLQRAASNAETIPENVLLTFPTGPFFGPSNASDHHPFKKKAYQRHAKRHFDEFAGDPIADRLHFYAQGIATRLRHHSDQRPTHGQVIAIAQEGESIIAEAKRQKAAGLNLPVNRLKQIFVISGNDSFACPSTATDYANLIGAEIIAVQAEHNPLMNTEVRNNRILSRINSAVQGMVPDAIIPAYDEEAVSQGTQGAPQSTSHTGKTNTAGLGDNSLEPA